MSDMWQDLEWTLPPAGSSAACTVCSAAACTDARTCSDPGRDTPSVQAEHSAAGISACLLPLRHCHEH